VERGRLLALLLALLLAGAAGVVVAEHDSGSVRAGVPVGTAPGPGVGTPTH
jgi:hypothetical protein